MRKENRRFVVALIVSVAISNHGGLENGTNSNIFFKNQQVLNADFLLTIT
jgi:hypothetical protein